MNTLIQVITEAIAMGDSTTGANRNASFNLQNTLEMVQQAVTTYTAQIPTGIQPTTGTTFDIAAPLAGGNSKTLQGLGQLPPSPFYRV